MVARLPYEDHNIHLILIFLLPFFRGEKVSGELGSLILLKRPDIVHYVGAFSF